MGIEKIYIDLDLKEGDSVKVINGPFENFMGVVEEVNVEKQTLRAKISMFGRETPVELDFSQVDKIQSGLKKAALLNSQMKKIEDTVLYKKQERKEDAIWQKRLKAI